MGRTKGNRSWQDKSQKTGLKGVVKKLLPFKSKKVKSRTPKLQAFKNVRPTPTKKNKKSAGITATSTPKSSIKVKVTSKIKHHNPADTTPGAPDFIPLETSPSPAYRRSGRKKSPVERLVTNNGPPMVQNGPKPQSILKTPPPPSPATIIANARKNVQKFPIVIDITQTEDEATPPAKNNDVVLLGARKSILKNKAKSNNTKEPGEISIDDEDVSGGEITIVGEKKPLRRFPSVLNRQTPAKAKGQEFGGTGQFQRPSGFADYIRESHRRDRRNQPYPTMGTKASSRSRLKTGGSSGQDLQRIEALPILQQPLVPPNQQHAPIRVCPTMSPSTNPNNLIQAVKDPLFKTGKRPIVIDGSNVAVQHSIAIGKGPRFSSHGVKICVDFFVNRGHEVTVFVPQYRTKNGQADDRHILTDLYNAGTLAYTPSQCYDDRYVLQFAQTCGGIVVSNDQYNDIKNESPEMFFIATKRKLSFTWAKNTLMFPPDPMGREGPSLDTFLKF